VRRRIAALAGGLLLGAATVVGCSSGSGGTTAATSNPACAAPGLAETRSGYTLSAVDAPSAASRPGTLTFHITGPDGKPVTGFDEEHGKQLHLIVVRSDASHYRHVHPAMASDGTWSLPWTWAVGGDYRVFADFAPAGGPGDLVLGRRVDVTGDTTPVAIPAPSRVADTDGYRVGLAGDLTTGGSELTLAIAKDGVPVTDLDPYLGAYGHLVALRTSDLAYLHVHPLDGPAGPAIIFHAVAPSDGQYRLYLDFSHRGAVHTAEFTVNATTTPPTSMPSMPGMN